jgi:hypothetical protein
MYILKLKKMKEKKLHEEILKSIKDLPVKDIIEKSNTKKLRTSMTKKTKAGKIINNKGQDSLDDRLDEL